MVTHTALWAAIEAHEIDKPDANDPFSKKLREGQKWSEIFTKAAILEYKRFIYLVAISPTMLSPSKIVDEVWHLHLTYTKDYWDTFCAKVIGRPIHHNPSDGADVLRFHNAYDDCLKLYQSEFEQAPPLRFWPQKTIKKNPPLWRAFLCLMGTAVLVSGCTINIGYMVEHEPIVFGLWIFASILYAINAAQILKTKYGFLTLLPVTLGLYMVAKAGAIITEFFGQLYYGYPLGVIVSLLITLSLYSIEIKAKTITEEDADSSGFSHWSDRGYDSRKNTSVWDLIDGDGGGDSGGSCGGCGGD